MVEDGLEIKQAYGSAGGEKDGKIRTHG